MDTAVQKTIYGLMQIKGIGAGFIKKKQRVLIALRESDIKSNIQRILELEKKDYDISNLIEIEEDTEKIFDICQDESIQIVSIVDGKYPSLLRESNTPPPILFCKGNLDCLNQNIISIIGARKSDEVGNKIAERISSHFNKRGYSICNGLSEGIDSHSIKKEGIYFNETIGILGGGLNFEKYNTVNKIVQENANNVLINNGLILSAYKPHEKENTYSVIDSCKIQSGIAKGLILIQASVSGGSRFTIKSLVEQSKPLGVVYSPSSENLDMYTANELLIEGNRERIASWLETKESNINLNMITKIVSKIDYDDFDHLLNPPFIPTLF